MDEKLKRELAIVIREILEMNIETTQLSVEQLKSSEGCAIKFHDFDFEELEVAIVRQIQGDDISMILIDGTISLKISEYEKTWIAYDYVNNMYVQKRQES